MAMKNSNDINGNRTRELPACSALPQLTVPPRARTRIWPAHKENKHAFCTELHAVIRCGCRGSHRSVRED